MNKCAVILGGLLFILSTNLALESNKQRINANADFLLHEGGVQTNIPKRDESISSSNNNNGGKRDYISQWPALGPAATPKSTSTTAFNNINSWPQSKPQASNPKRDYVAPQLPSHKPVTPKTTTTSNNNLPGLQSNAPSSNSKRDYVSPHFPTLKPSQNNQPVQNNQQMKDNQATGTKVKDLINFYDNKNPTPTPPSFSSILRGSTNKNGATTATASPILPTKPMSFSSVVAGGNKPRTPARTTPEAIVTAPSTPGHRPGTPVLPSTIVNNNRDTNSNNANTVTDAELQTLSEELLRKDSNNAARFITVNYQDKTTSQSTEDKAPRPLLTISPDAWNIPTVQKLIPLLDNYERDSLVNEHVTPQERIEENNFMDAIMSTTVMRHLMTFLKNKGFVSPDPKQQRDFVKQLWFTLYSRGKGKLGSSGFEHIFVSELKNGGVSGLHNWVYFSREEAANRINYLGWLKYVEFNNKGVVLKFHFNQQGTDKPVNTMFIGTSPELELALYTLCFVTRVDNDCNVKLGNKDVNIITYNYRYRSKNLVGSAYPQI